MPKLTNALEIEYKWTPIKVLLDASLVASNERLYRAYSHDLVLQLDREIKSGTCPHCNVVIFDRSGNAWIGEID